VYILAKVRNGNANETRHPLSFFVHCDQYPLGVHLRRIPLKFSHDLRVFEYLRISSNRSYLLRSALQEIGLVVRCLQEFDIVVG